MKEIVICSAIKMKDGTVIRGHRHNDCIKTVYHSMGYIFNQTAEAEQGFITSANRFVSREEGLKLQLEAGIESVNKNRYDKVILFSEDLY